MKDLGYDERGTLIRNKHDEEDGARMNGHSEETDGTHRSAKVDDDSVDSIENEIGI